MMQEMSRLARALFPLLAVGLLPNTLPAGENSFSPDVVFLARDIDPTLFGPGDATASIQSLRVVCPQPAGFVIHYSPERAEFYFADRAVVGVDFLPRRLVPALGGHFRQARVDLAAASREADYVATLINLAGFAGKARPVGGAEVVQNTPRSIIVRIRVAPVGGEVGPEKHMDLLHGYFTLGSSLLEFNAVAARGDEGAPVGAAMFTAWLERVLQKNR